MREREVPPAGFPTTLTPVEAPGCGKELEVTTEEFIDAGDRVLVTAHHRGRGRGSGIEVDRRFYLVYSLRNGKVARADEYADRTEALEAAGLSE
jgi:ketosteroid isomerase-like protein